MRELKSLTESTCSQAASVYARCTGWDEWFTHAPAGPWKRINVPGVDNLAAKGFEKDETRPDLILYYGNTDKKLPVPTDPIILIIESKDKIGKLDKGQMIKTCKNFLDIKIKLEELIKTSTDKTLSSSAGSLNYICGYVIGGEFEGDKFDSVKIDKLKKIHFKLIDESIFPNFVVIIVKKDGYELSTKILEISQKDTKQIASLEEIF